MAEIHEECGVFGIWCPDEREVAQLAYYGLVALQHRGQESAGIAVNRDRTITVHRDIGSVHEVFDRATVENLGPGTMACGHVRYSTSGGVTRENAQPMLVKHVKGQLAICHNGNLVNSFDLRRKLELSGCIFHSTSDTEVIAYIITRERLHSGAIEEAVARAMDTLEGAYSLVIMSPSKLIACRDPYGFRPLCYGMTEDGCIVFASESCALDAIGATFVRDLLPGEIVIADKKGVRSDKRHCGVEGKNVSRCIFEYIYFSRPDSVVDGVSVHEFRVGAGRALAREYPADADIVVGVPDSGLDAATGFAKESGIPFALGLIKNKYIGRTFIAPTQKERTDLVRMKLNAIRPVIEGRRVVLVDDSIVRGTTSARIIRLVRGAGAKEVHMRISSPPFLNPCYYGTDIDSREHLIACRHSVPEIAKIIGADSLGYLSVEAAEQLAGYVSPDDWTAPDGRKLGFGCCSACFNGRYPTTVPDEYSKENLEK